MHGYQQHQVHELFIEYANRHLLGRASSLINCSSCAA
jgi:hypothetical protein